MPATAGSSAPPISAGATIGFIALAVWALGVSLLSGYWMARHALPLRGPGNAEVLSAIPAPGGWRAYHILGTGCDCSLFVARHLAARAPQDGFAERILILGSDDQALRQALAPSRIPLCPQALAEEVLDRAGVGGAPWLVVIDPGNHLAYSGGYREGAVTDSDGIRDTWILAAIRAGHPPRPFPAIGCAVSRSYARPPSQ